MYTTVWFRLDIQQLDGSILKASYSTVDKNSAALLQSKFQIIVIALISCGRRLNRQAHKLNL
jgi:hypothetical protein